MSICCKFTFIAIIVLPAYTCRMVFCKYIWVIFIRFDATQIFHQFFTLFLVSTSPSIFNSDAYQWMAINIPISSLNLGHKLKLPFTLDFWANRSYCETKKMAFNLKPSVELYNSVEKIQMYGVEPSRTEPTRAKPMHSILQVLHRTGELRNQHLIKLN